jgi:hypothetical protein
VKKLLALLASGLLISLLSVPSLNGTVAIGQENFGPPTDLQFNVEGDEFNVEVQREEGQQADAAAAAAAGAIGLVGFLIWLAMSIVVIVAAGWVVFTKAGKPGWAAIVPDLQLNRSHGDLRPAALVDRSVVDPMCSDRYRRNRFNRSREVFWQRRGFWNSDLAPARYFLPILAFGSAQYQGPAAAESK